MSSRIYTTRRLKSASGADIKGTTGKYIRVRIHKENRTVLKVKEDNWTDEAHARYAELFPEGKDVKKVKTPKAKVAKKAKITKKKPAPKKSADEKLAEEQKALIAAMVGDAATDKLEEKTDEIPVTDAIAQAQEQDAKQDEDDLEEEELEEEELEELDEDEETPEFPGEEEIEEFEHDSLAQYEGVDFYVDENANVWDEHMQFVGKYDEDEDALAIVEGYEPEVDED